MGHINGAYTTYFNTKRKRSGHLFQGCYKSILVEADAYATELSGYIHLNPVRAGIVARPEEFLWSSYRAYIGEIERSDWLKTDFVLKLITADHTRAPGMYREFVEGRLGRDDFVRIVTEKHLFRDQRESQRVPLCPTNWHSPIEQIIAAVDSAFAEDTKAARKAAIYLCHKLSGKTLREIGSHFGLGESGVSQACRRYEVTFGQDPSLERKLAALRTELKGGTHRVGGSKAAKKREWAVERLEQKISEVLKRFPGGFRSYSGTGPVHREDRQKCRSRPLCPAV